MEISQLLRPEAILLQAPVTTKEQAVELLVSLHASAGNLLDADRYRADVWEREREGNTALTGGIAIPHAKSSGVKTPGLAVLIAKEQFDCDALDGEKTDLFFMIAAPENANLHIEMLAALSRLLLDEAFCNRLRNVRSSWELLALISEKEGQLHGGGPPPESQGGKAGGYKILAVTACPTGIAHTYMAAQALKEAAQRMNIRLKVETNGASGISDPLSQEEIQEASCILVAADRSLNLDRFEGKALLLVGVGKAVQSPESLLYSALSGEAPIYRKKNVSPALKKDFHENGVHRFYRYLMNGVSHMLPFVVGGGILVALAYLLDDYTIDLSSFGMNTTLAAFFYHLGYAAFGFMLPVLSGYIAYSIADRAGLMVGIVGGYLARMGMTVDSPGGEVSAGFLGAMLAGFVGGFLVLGIQWLLRFLPAKIDSLKSMVLVPVLGLVGIGVVMMLVDPFMVYLNNSFIVVLQSMNDSSVLVLGALLGAMTAIDMGGPLNKATYVFATAALASQEYTVMAAVMVGGMAAPLITALSTTLYPAGFNEVERKNGLANYVLGACFITEGAIPFAAADPLRVIPACTLGAAVAGASSMAFRCALMAPHGGLLVFPLVENMWGYLISLGLGVLVGTGVLITLKWGRKLKYTGIGKKVKLKGN